MDTPSAITEFRIYLDQAPNASNAAQVRERLLSLQASGAGPLAPPDASKN